MKYPTRKEIFAQAAKKMRQDFAALSIVPHAGAKGTEAEDLVRRFLRGHLPKRFEVGSGFIIDQNNNMSKQTDIIIYDALNCPVYRASDTAAIIPSDNVAAVIEVKSRLDKERMEEAFANIAAVKGLAKTQPPNVPILVTTQTYCAIFAFDTSLTLNTLSLHFRDDVHKYKIGRHADVAMVLDKGLITFSAKMPGQPGWNPLMMEGLGGKESEGAHLGAVAMEIGENSLDMFVRLLLVHLMHFRDFVGHPGFDWSNVEGRPEGTVTYLTSITHEKDPALRDKKLKQYADEVRAEFVKNPVPPKSASESAKKTSSKSASAESKSGSVIHLPDQTKP